MSAALAMRARRSRNASSTARSVLAAAWASRLRMPATPADAALSAADDRGAPRAAPGPGPSSSGSSRDASPSLSISHSTASWASVPPVARSARAARCTPYPIATTAASKPSSTGGEAVGEGSPPPALSHALATSEACTAANRAAWPGAMTLTSRVAPSGAAVSTPALSARTCSLTFWDDHRRVARSSARPRAARGSAHDAPVDGAAPASTQSTRCVVTVRCPSWNDRGMVGVYYGW